MNEPKNLITPSLEPKIITSEQKTSVTHGPVTGLTSSIIGIVLVFLLTLFSGLVIIGVEESNGVYDKEYADSSPTELGSNPALDDPYYFEDEEEVDILN